MELYCERSIMRNILSSLEYLMLHKSRVEQKQIWMISPEPVHVLDRTPSPSGHKPETLNRNGKLVDSADG